MSMPTYWVRATTPVEVTDDFTDRYGSKIDEGNLGVLLDGGGTVAIEGTRDELLDLAQRIEQAVADWNED